ncbi:RIBOSOMAL PROTEIN S7 [Salix purpurea]|uniref:RIBOSOMAL PROTEIN S7 n=1 Tax=Salix purpurea TaxID=77065 RepID=A0A9Q0WA17_SALPP|nr:RIBOSOMAL PROTEIN S7 [Salix purpurea]
MGSNDCVISIFRPRHRKRLPIARKFSAIRGAWMVSKNQLIKKLVSFRMKEGKRTRVRAIVYQTFHRPARTERDVIKLMVDAIENIKPICEVEKVGVAGTLYDVPGIVGRDRQQTLAIRWILEAAFKRRISYRISLEKCSLRY